MTPSDDAGGGECSSRSNLDKVLGFQDLVRKSGLVRLRPASFVTSAQVASSARFVTSCGQSGT